MAAETLVSAEPLLTGDGARRRRKARCCPTPTRSQRGDDRAAVLQRMMDAHDELLAELWAQRQPGLPLATPEEAVTLASIVEKETGVAVGAAARGRRSSSTACAPACGWRATRPIIYGVTGGPAAGPRASGCRS